MWVFEHLEVDQYLEVVDRKATTFRSEHKYLIKAKAPSRFFVREYGWTGSGSVKEHIPDVISGIDVWGFPKHRIHGPLLIEDEIRIIVVDLGRTIELNGVETVYFKHKMKDLNGTFKPFLGARPKHKIKKLLKLSIKIPDWNGIQVHYQKSTPDNNRVIDSVKIDPSKIENGKILYEKEIFKPYQENLGHKLTWSHKEN